MCVFCGLWPDVSLICTLVVTARSLLASSLVGSGFFPNFLIVRCRWQRPDLTIWLTESVWCGQSPAPAIVSARFYSVCATPIFSRADHSSLSKFGSQVILLGSSASVLPNFTFLQLSSLSVLGLSSFGHTGVRRVWALRLLSLPAFKSHN